MSILGHLANKEEDEQSRRGDRGEAENYQEVLNRELEAL